MDSAKTNPSSPWLPAYVGMELSCPPETGACAMLMGGRGSSKGMILIGWFSSSSEELLSLGVGITGFCGCCGLC